MTVAIFHKNILNLLADLGELYLFLVWCKVYVSQSFQNFQLRPIAMLHPKILGLCWSACWTGFGSKRASHFWYLVVITYKTE